MTYDIRLSDAALHDIDSAYHYIRVNLMNQAAADSLLTKTESVMRSLSSYPERFSLVNDPVLRSWGIRSVMVDNYTVFYAVDRDIKRINIIRFLHFRRNYASILSHEEASDNDDNNKECSK